MTTSTTVLPFQPDSMTPAQLAAVLYLARYSGQTHLLYAYQLRRWFAWCEWNGLDALIGVQRAHVELYVRHLRECGLRDSSICTMMHGVRGNIRFAHIDDHIAADPAVYVRPPKLQSDETRTQRLDRIELIRFLQVAQTITVHHGALAFLLGVNALRGSEAAAVRIEDYAETLRGHRVLRLVGKGSKPATMPITVPVLRVLEACRGERTEGRLVLRPVSGKPINRRDVYRMVRRVAVAAGIPRHISPHSLRHAAITNALDAGVPIRDAQILARHATPGRPSTTTAHAVTSTATASTSSLPMSPASDLADMKATKTPSSVPSTRSETVALLEGHRPFLQLRRDRSDIAQFTGGDSHGEAEQLAVARRQPHPIEGQKEESSGQADAFVAVDEWVRCNE